MAVWLMLMDERFVKEAPVVASGVPRLGRSPESATSMLTVEPISSGARRRPGIWPPG